MLGCDTIFNAKNDYQQLLQFISIYGLHKMQDIANALDRTLEIRGLTQHHIFMNNGHDGLNSESYVTGYENVIQTKATLAHWIKQKREHLHDCDDDKSKNKKYREWSDDIYDLLDKLTEPNPLKRVTPKQALKHKIFDEIRMRNRK